MKDSYSTLTEIGPLCQIYRMETSRVRETNSRPLSLAGNVGRIESTSAE